jgi:hypothetical protein
MMFSKAMPDAPCRVGQELKEAERCGNLRF